MHSYWGFLIKEASELGRRLVKNQGKLKKNKQNLKKHWEIRKKLKPGPGAAQIPGGGGLRAGAATGKKAREINKKTNEIKKIIGKLRKIKN